LKRESRWKNFASHAQPINYFKIRDLPPKSHLNANKIRVAVLAKAGLGGTEKAATTYAAALVGRGYTVDYLADHGPRENYLITHGVRVLNAGGTPQQLRAYIENAEPHIIHQHVPGYPCRNPLYPALRQLRSDVRKPKIIETNVFGRLEDPEAARFVDFRVFISMASAAQAFRRARISNLLTLLDRHTVLYYPVLPPKEVDSAARTALRRQLGVAEGEVLAVRVGRPGHKWAAWECEAYALAKRHVPQLRLFLMEPPRKLAQKIANGKFGTGIILRNETSDFRWLEQLYAAADLMIHASDHGESFGYTVAEGMAAGLPVITRSTPWCDNAQVELVENSKTGFVGWSVPEMGRRLVDLAQNQTMRLAMGVAGRKRILSLANLENEIDLLETVIAQCLHNESNSKLQIRKARLLEFVRQFSALEKNTSETVSNHPIDFVAASVYVFYRKSRARLRSLLNRWQRREGKEKGEE
jgi:glycosyltransferase involved in cell wall biosynthesis